MLARLLDALQAAGTEPVVNPRRGKLPGVVVTRDRPAVVVAWGVFAFVAFVLATAVGIAFADRLGGFIYAAF